MPDTALTKIQLAQRRTDWALGNTVMALERTLMAWLRTALALISFGFTIYKLLEGLKEQGNVTMRLNAPRNLGLFLILLGMALLGVGIIEYRIAKKKLMSYTEKTPPFSMTLAACFGILAVGVFTILNIFFGIGGF